MRALFNGGPRCQAHSYSSIRAWLCLGLGLVFALGGGGSSASPAHSLLCSGATERGWVGGSSPGSWEQGGLGGQGAGAPGQHRRPVIDSCSSGSLHLLGESFLGKGDRHKRKQGGVLRSLAGSAALPGAQAPPLQA